MFQEQDYVKLGDKVSFVSSKGKTIVGIITDINHGTKYLRISITDSEKHLWTYKSSSHHYSAGLNYIGSSSETEEQAANKIRHEKETERYNKKYEDVKALDKISVGDTITIKGRTHNWNAEVDEINYREGKVGIKIPGSDTRISYGKRVRTHQWIPMHFVLDVKKGNGILKTNCISIPEKVLNAMNNNSRYQSELDSQTYTQIQFSNGEFICDSYALSKEKRTLDRLASYRHLPDVKLAMYDSSDTKVKFDEVRKLYWLNTGCFD
jgi:hypothetical protein